MNTSQNLTIFLLYNYVEVFRLRKEIIEKKITTLIIFILNNEKTDHFMRKITEISIKNRYSAKFSYIALSHLLPAHPVPFTSFGDRSKWANYNWYQCHLHVLQLSWFSGKVKVLLSFRFL